MQLHGSEIVRLLATRRRRSDWQRWGPYVSNRSWGTVREDYSSGEDPWTFFPHDHASRRTYRWGEDGIAGFCDDRQYLCFAPSFWNGRDSILKERLFGLNAWEGNHGEDVKEHFFYLDSTPTYSYARFLYKYPKKAFPYIELVSKNQRRGKLEAEYELENTGVFDGQNYFDIFVEYAKSEPDDMVIRISVFNRSSRVSTLHLLPTLWFRNTWSWGYPAGPAGDVPEKPVIRMERRRDMPPALRASHPCLGDYFLYADRPGELLFTDNETNTNYCFGVPNKRRFLKDAFQRYLIAGDKQAVNRSNIGTKAAYLFPLQVRAKSAEVVILRLSNTPRREPLQDAEEIFTARRAECESYYKRVIGAHLSEAEKNVFRQAAAGMLWSKQFYYYDVEQWLKGDPGQPPPPPRARNRDWTHLRNADVISMPDKWEFPWYASWDLAFHTVALALLDADFAKKQLVLFTREWYMHPNGELPAYEWQFGDVNPPVHAWAALQVYYTDMRQRGRPDVEFLEVIFQKLLLNFTCWVNRRDPTGRNVFQGGFLGLDNIGVFDRSKPLDSGGQLMQADGTSWMAAYCLFMLEMSLELAKYRSAYQDASSKFLEHFMRVRRSMTEPDSDGDQSAILWDEKDGFFYDVIQNPDGTSQQLKIRSLVGLIPLCAGYIIQPNSVFESPYFHSRLQWLCRNRPELVGPLAQVDIENFPHPQLVSLYTEERLRRVLSRVFDESEFLSPFGIRSLSKYHAEFPYELENQGVHLTVKYEPGESTTDMFGGNSNWRGPIWFPLNYLLVQAIERMHRFFGDGFIIDYPTGSGHMRNLGEVASDLRRRMISLFLLGPNGVETCPSLSGNRLFALDDHYRGLHLFHEHFHGDTGRGLGASHQTGWTGLVINLLNELGGR